MTPPTYTTSGRLAFIVLHNPPVNTLAHAVRAHIIDGIVRAEDDGTVAAVIIMGSDSCFSAGAEVREFGTTGQAPSLSEVCHRIEECRKPVIAAIHGYALGGGLEIALAAHYRLALRSARLGLPEVHLGLLPGAGGTQRAPRLMGVKPALDLILGGKPVGATEALQAGLIDRIAEGDDIKAAALGYAEALLSSGAGVRRTRDAWIDGQDDAVTRQAATLALQHARSENADKAHNLLAPHKIIEAIEAAVTQSLDEGLAVERTAFLQCMDSPQHRGLAHAFFAERKVLKAPETDSAEVRPVASVGVIGGGTMGVGIALAVLDAGLPVVMVERDEASLARGMASVAKSYDGLVSKRRMTPQGKSTALERLAGATAYAALAEVDLVIEAVFEDLDVKKALFAELDRVCKPGAILATNTSYLDIPAMAAQTGRPGDVIGLHFFSPANVMKLLEIVVPPATSAEVVATAFALARKLRKLPVRAGICDGFIGNRILAVYRQAADYMVEDGASPYQIDRALRDFGFPMGPYQVSDLAGGDIGWATRKRKAAGRDPRARYVEIADRLCERGWFGQKTGRGYYSYVAGQRSGTPEPEVLTIIDSERARAGVTPRGFSDGEIVRRYLAAMINEGAKVVEEGIAMRPLDVDVTLLAGYGFPRFRGGPMKYADMVGLDKILADIREFAQADALFWQPAALLVRLAERGATFDSLNNEMKRKSHA